MILMQCCLLASQMGFFVAKNFFEVMDDRNHEGRIAYAYNFGPGKPLWRYIFVGALIPFATLKIVERLQMRTIPRWQYIMFCSLGGNKLYLILYHIIS